MFPTNHNFLAADGQPIVLSSRWLSDIVQGFGICGQSCSVSDAGLGFTFWPLLMLDSFSSNFDLELLEVEFYLLITNNLNHWAKRSPLSFLELLRWVQERRFPYEWGIANWICCDPKINGRWLIRLCRVLKQFGTMANWGILNSHCGGDGLIQKAIGRCQSGGGFEWKYRERL